MSSTSSVISGIGLSFIFFYCISKILNFYGFQMDNYGIYLAFYAFLLLTSFIIPRYYKVNI